MKHDYKTFVEPATFLLTTVLIFLMLLAPLFVFCLLATEGEISDLSDSEALRFYFLELILLTCDIAALLVMAPRGWATVTLYVDRVTWRAPFRKSVTLKYDEIKYAGIDYSNTQNNDSLKLKEAEALYLSSYIYLSALPYIPSEIATPSAPLFTALDL